MTATCLLTTDSVRAAALGALRDVLHLHDMPLSYDRMIKSCRVYLTGSQSPTPGVVRIMSIIDMCDAEPGPGDCLDEPAP